VKPQWSLHVLNARGQLDRHLETLTAVIRKAEADLRTVTDPVALDLVVRASDWPSPPELVVSGGCYAPGRIDIEVDVQNRAVDHMLEVQLRLTLLHEFHHLLRWDGPGYGKTLGEALVSEGLAQHFVHEMEDCDPEPWEIAVPLVDLPAYARSADALFDDPKYSHAEWFFGQGELQKWVGYALGHQLTSAYLRDHPKSTALTLAHESASEFRPYLRRMADIRDSE
jgi:Predicted Zn-dependent protease (DUF2268)